MSSALRKAAQQALEALILAPTIKVWTSDDDYCEQESPECKAAITALRAALAEPEPDDPAIHFCHRFAILMECMVLSNDSNLDKYWDEAHALLDGYNSARDKWMEAQGQPYVSGFGKD